MMLHLVLIDLDPILVPLHRALVLSLPLSRLGLGKLDLLPHERRILLKVDVLVVQLVLLRVQLALQLIVLLRNLQPLHLILLLLLVEDFLLLQHQVLLRLNLVLKSDL